MGRGTRTSSAHAALREGADPFASMQPASDPGPNWVQPKEFALKEARAFVSPDGQSRGGMDLDESVALRLLRLRLGSNDRFRAWYEGSRSLVASPEQTVPGMTAAGEMLSQALRDGERVAVFCDFDVDGTSAGEAVRRGLLPYTSEGQLLFGYADAQRGFGVTNAFVEEAAAAGAKVLMTLDCGSGQVSQVRLAQSLGMRVIVADHHSADPENPAEFHLNPRLYEPATSSNTGAQLAWKLAAATQIAREGRTRPEHWETAMWAAGAGCLADMGSVLLPENRAFFWSAHEHVPPGIAALAAEMGEDPTVPGGLIRTQAIMNLPKRTPHAHASEVGRLWAVDDAEQAAPIVEHLVGLYRLAQPRSVEMLELSLQQVPEQTRDASGNRAVVDPKVRVAHAVLDGFEEFNGYSGTVAGRVSARSGKPAFIFVSKGTDEHGQDLYRFSSRNESGIKASLGELELVPEMREACTILRRDEADQVVAQPACGGHDAVFSGTCTRESIPAVMQAAQDWADRHDTWYPAPYDGPAASVTARRVDGARLATIEAQARQLGPYTKRDTVLDPSRPHFKMKHKEVCVSAEGTVTITGPHPERPETLVGLLTMNDGATREITWPREATLPPGGRAEWILRISGKQEPYWLRSFHPIAGAQA